MSLNELTVSRAEGPPRARRQHSDYTVACLCPMGIELAPVEAMLDAVHETLPVSRDYNAYSLGRIGTHNVVILVMPETGNNTAAIAATQLLNDFPSVRFGFLVGIGGGLPDASHDIRLGDVAVSQAKDLYGGVVQYDRGKIILDGRLQRTGSINKAPAILTSTVQLLKARHEREGSQITSIISQMLELYPRMKARFACPGADKDQLYKSTYVHQGGSSCEECDIAFAEPRSARSDSAPSIHYGTIGSANVVLKDSNFRDTLRKNLDIICVEMEAAGILDALPCLVIRGICDYADSHKNKDWQPYAAATAAAYFKELLQLVPARNGIDLLPPVNLTNVQSMLSSHHEHRAIDVSRHHTSNTDEGRPHKMRKVMTTQDEPEILQYHEQRRRVMEALQFDGIDFRHAAIEIAHEKTCRWFLELAEFRSWLDATKKNDHHRFLWIKGKPAAGKSTMMKFLLQHVQSTKSSDILISFFFNARGEGLEKSTEGMYRSLLLQLTSTAPDLQSAFDIFTSPHTRRNWDIKVLQNLFGQAVRELGPRSLTCFIDALDECDEEEIRDMVSFFEDISEIAMNNGISLYICFSSRHYPTISIENCLAVILEQQEGHTDDINAYISSKLKGGRTKQMTPIKQEILQRASGVFLWVMLVVKELNKITDSGRIHKIRERLKEIPNDLQSLFEDILTRDSKNLDELVLCLQWILHAKRTLTCPELYCAVLSDLGPDAVITKSGAIEAGTDVIDRFVLNASKGLAEKSRGKTPRVQFIHESVREFLLKDGGLRSLRSELSEKIAKPSNERFKMCCHTYLKLNHDQLLADIRRAQQTPEENTNVSRLEILSRYPFSDYANQYLLDHAEAADREGFEQISYIKSFNIDTWKEFANFSGSRKSLRYTHETDLAQILLQKDLPNLLAIAFQHIQGSALLSDEIFQGGLLHALREDNREIVKLLFQNASKPKPVSANRSWTHLQFSPQEFESSIDKLMEYAPFTRQKSAFSRILPWAILNTETRLSEVLLKIGRWNWTPTGASKLDGSRADRSALKLAAESGNLRFVQALLDDPAATVPSRRAFRAGSYDEDDDDGPPDALVDLSELAQQDDIGWTPLMYAAKSGSSELVKYFYESNRVTRVHFQYAVAKLCQQGPGEPVRLLMDVFRIPVNFRDEAGRTLLWLASLGGQSLIVTDLLSREGVEVNVRCSDLRHTPLMCAIFSGDEDTVKVLLAKKEVVLDGVDTRGRSTLWLAAYAGDPVIFGLYFDLVLLELTDKVNSRRAKCKLATLINTADREGVSPLMAAVAGGSFKIVDQLLSSELVDVGAISSYGHTACIIAAKNGHTSILRFLLLSEKIRVDERQKEQILYRIFKAAPSRRALLDHQMLLMLLEEQNKVRLLQMAKQGVPQYMFERFPRYYQSFSTVIQATEISTIGEIFRDLLTHSMIAADFVFLTGRSLLSEAVWQGLIPVVSHLIQAGVDPNVQDLDGSTCIRTAVEKNRIERHRIEENQVEKDIAKNFFVDMIRLLLSYGEFDIDVTAADGQSPLDVATKSGRPEIVEILTEYQRTRARTTVAAD